MGTFIQSFIKNLPRHLGVYRHPDKLFFLIWMHRRSEARWYSQCRTREYRAWGAGVQSAEPNSASVRPSTSTCMHRCTTCHWQECQYLLMHKLAPCNQCHTRPTDKMYSDHEGIYLHAIHFKEMYQPFESSFYCGAMK